MPPRLKCVLALLFLGLVLHSDGAAARVGEAQAAPALLADGPYVLWEGKEARVLAVRNGKRLDTRLRAPYDLELPGLSSLRLDPDPPAPGPAMFPAPERIAAVSDVHGNLDGLVALLQAHGILDAHRNWSFGRGHFVVLGDVFDRGAQVTDTLWLLRRLERQAQAAGGRLHFVLGNHEIGALRGDERYLHPAYAHIQTKVLQVDQKTLYGPSTDMGRWLRTRPVLLKIGPFLFAHGGPSPDWLEEERDIEAFNAAFRRAIDLDGSPRLQGKGSPIWYRGLIPGAEKKRGEASDEDIRKLLAGFGVHLFVVGHTTLKQGITAFHSGCVHGIDADLQSGAPGELWLFEKGVCTRGLRDGTTLPLPSAGPTR